MSECLFGSRGAFGLPLHEGHVWCPVCRRPAFKSTCPPERTHRSCTGKRPRIERWLMPMLAGDAIYYLAMGVGLHQVVQWSTKKAGVECRCPERRERLNNWHRRTVARITRRWLYFKMRWLWLGSNVPR